jgi:hypothetical protein
VEKYGRCCALEGGPWKCIWVFVTWSFFLNSTYEATSTVLGSGMQSQSK